MDATTPPPPNRTERLFLALTLPAAVRAVLESLPQSSDGIAWTHPEQLHVTLRFLGDVSAEQKDRLVAKLETVHVEPFVLPIEGVGSFPPNRPPRVLWVGTGAGHPRLFQLRQRIDDAVLACGLDVDLRAFHPHVTVARCSEHATSAANHWLHAHRAFTAPPFRPASFDLYASELRPTGAVHTLKRRFALTR